MLKKEGGRGARPPLPAESAGLCTGKRGTWPRRSGRRMGKRRSPGAEVSVPGPVSGRRAGYAFSPSGMMQVMRVRQLQEFQPDQGHPSEATGPGEI